MNKIIIFGIIFLLMIGIVNAGDLMSLTMNIYDNAGNPADGDIFVEIWDSVTGGTMIYNSTDDFLNNVTNGRVDIMLGKSESSAGLQELNLEYGKIYYMEINANGTDLDFNGLERQQFTSSIGNITSLSISPGNITSDLLDLNITISDSLLVDYIYPDSLTYVTIENVSILEDLRVSGTSYFNNIDMDGNRLTDVGELIVNGLTHAQNITPITTDLYSLGNSTNWWNELYVRTIHADTIYADDVWGVRGNFSELNSSEMTSNVMEVKENLTIGVHEIIEREGDLIIIIN